jgi:hypothetical protein
MGAEGLELKKRLGRKCVCGKKIEREPQQEEQPGKERSAEGSGITC